MADLASWQYLLIGLLFVWSGFVRSGLGFGGGVLTLPFLLLILNAPLVFLPLVSVHLLFFTSLTIFLAHRKARQQHKNDSSAVLESNINWAFLRYAFPLMLIPKLIGVIGVIALPASIVSGFIFTLVMIYSISYMLERPFKSGSTRIDAVFLILGGYVSGTSLAGAPLVVPVAASRVPREQLRDTLFVLWFVLVGMKLIAFAISGVDMQWREHLWLLPCAAVGHVLGLRFHKYTLRADTKVFFRILGVGLFAVSAVGIFRLVYSA